MLLDKDKNTTKKQQQNANIKNPCQRQQLNLGNIASQS